MNQQELIDLKFKFSFVLREIKAVFVFQGETPFFPRGENIFYINYSAGKSKVPPPTANSLDYLHLGHSCSMSDLVKIETNKWWKPVHSKTIKVLAKHYNKFYLENDMSYYYFPILDYVIENDKMWFILGWMSKSYIQELRDAYEDLECKLSFHFKNTNTGVCTCGDYRLNNSCFHCKIVQLD